MSPINNSSGKIFLAIFFNFICFSGVKTDTKAWNILVSDNITAEIGQDVTMPCTFSTPYTEYDNITVIWKRKMRGHFSIIFTCLSRRSPSDSGQNCTNSFGKAAVSDLYMLAGNPQQQNVSLTIKNVMYADKGTYSCRVQLNKAEDSYETPDGTKLIINVPTKIRKLYLEVDGSGKLYVTCEVTGLPPPIIEWVQPANLSLSQTSVTYRSYFTSSTIYNVQPNTTYTCQINTTRVEDRRSIHIYGAFEEQAGFPPELDFFLMALSVVLTLLVIALSVSLYMKGRKTSNEDPPSNLYGNMPKERCKTKQIEADDIYQNVST